VTRAISLLALVVPALALAAGAPGPRKLTLVISGDNGGEIAPCG
jgi:hypothetical protein